jgi:DNA gyrase subunit B
MEDLIKKGYVYIAQPPLFKIKKGRTEKYIRTSREMDDFLIDEGIKGLTATVDGGQTALSNVALKEVAECLRDLEKLAGGMERKGITFQEYLRNRQPGTGRLPMYMVEVEGVREFLFSEKDYAKYREMLEERRQGLLPLDAVGGGNGNPPEEEEETPTMEFAESREMEGLLKKLQRHGITPDNCMKPDDPEAPVCFILRKDNAEIPVRSAMEILFTIKSLARQGLTIQRYKGLGEMNPEQLWETTMNPETRTILQVKLEDALAAETVFNDLMGEKVEPRREFIEAHALDVRNLDI